VVLQHALMIAVYIIVGLLVLGLLGLALSLRILNQYERGVQFRLGKADPPPQPDPPPHRYPMWSVAQKNPIGSGS
jgi:hypothetical protein